MPDDADSTPDPNGGEEPQPTEVQPSSPEELARALEEANVRREQLEAQLKGEQRNNARLRKDLASGIEAEGLREELKTVSGTVDELVDALRAQMSGEGADPEIIDGIRSKSAQSRERIAAATTARKQIADKLSEAGVDWEDDSLKTARAYYEGGQLDKAVAEVESVTKKDPAAVEAQIAAEVERRLKEKGASVDPNATPASTAPKKDSAEARILAGDYDDPRAVLTAWVAENQP